MKLTLCQISAMEELLKGFCVSTQVFVKEIQIGSDHYTDQIDPRHFPKPSLPPPDERDLQLCLASLERSYKAVNTFLLKNCRQDPGRLRTSPNLGLIARGEGVEELINLLELVILAAFKSTNKTVFAKEVQGLPEAT